MTTDACPECGGVRLRRHPAGPLVISHDARCTLGNADDGTRENDAAELHRWAHEYIRSTRPHERTLLAAVAGIDPIEVSDRVVVTPIAGTAVVRRTWDGIDPDPADPDLTDPEITP